MHPDKSRHPWRWAWAGAAAIAAGVCLLRGGAFDGSLTAWLRLLSDGCFIAGALYISAYLLLHIARAGGFDMTGYMGHAMARLFSRRRDAEKKQKDYYAYRTEKEAARQAREPSPVPRALLGVGFACLALSLLLVGGYLLAA
ncbi:MAG: DUF3899 domain-containing protein [Aristaeellaceae bacterium]